jgi:hypothetical protein
MELYSWEKIMGKNRENPSYMELYSWENHGKI